MLFSTCFQHPLRIAGRTLWLCGSLVLIGLDYLMRAGLSSTGPTQKVKARWLQRSSRKLSRIFNLDVQTIGTVPIRGLLVCNHLSYLDILLLGALAPVTFVSKHEVRSWPVFGWFARLAGTVFVHRERRGDVARSSAEIRGALDDGALVVLFPEGTSSDGKTVLPFKSALLEPASQQNESVYAACIRYALADGSVADEACYWRDMTLV